MKLILLISNLIIFCPIAICQNFELCTQQKARNYINCHCDDKCQLYGDCCHTQTNKSSETNHSSLSVPDCLASLTYSKEHPVFVWNKCSYDYDNDRIRNLCESETSIIESYIPVFTKDELLFRNYFCALCNHINKSDIFVPISSLQIQCDSFYAKEQPLFESLPTYINKNRCNINTNFSSSIKRRCYRNVIDQCPQSSSNYLKSKCSSSPTYFTKCFHFQKRTYLNQACADCNSHNGNCIPVQAYESIPYNYKDSLFYEYSILLDFNRFDTWYYQTTESTNLTNMNYTSSPSINITKKSEDVADAVLSFVSTICTIISMISLLILACVYMATRELRNLGGKIIIILSFCIFLALVSFSVSRFLERNATACQIIAIFTHYAYLCSFLWMALYAFELLRTFKLRRTQRTTQSLMRLMYYCLCGFILPAILCVGAVLIDHFAHSHAPPFIAQLAPRYGQKQCNINSKWGLFAWMFVPVAVIIILNSIISVVLFWFFLKSYRKMGQAIKSKKALFFICLKMTVILGVSWVVYIIAVLVDYKPLTRIGAILNSLHGFFIMLCFLLNGKVFKSVKSSVSHKHRADHTHKRYVTIRYSRKKVKNREVKLLLNDSSSSSGRRVVADGSQTTKA